MKPISIAWRFRILHVRGWLTFDLGRWTTQSQSTWGSRGRLPISITWVRFSKRPHTFLSVKARLTPSRLIQFAGYLRWGVAVVNNWKKHYTRLLSDFERVFLFADGDNAGAEFGKMLAKELPNLTIVTMPDG